MGTHTPEDKERWMRFSRSISPTSDPKLMQLFAQFRQVSHSLYQKAQTGLDAINLSMPQFRILLHLLFAEQIEQRHGLHPSEISERQGTNRNTISSLVRSLEQAQWVRRELDQQDRRKFLICLTEAGRELVTDHARGHYAGVDQLFQTLTDAEVLEFGRILEKLNQSLECKK